jgi:hypothetical protein
MRLRSGKSIGETQHTCDVVWVDKMMKHYSDILADVHNENLEKPIPIYWEEMARVLTESYYILNQEFKNLYYHDKNHRDYLLKLEPQACRSIQMLYHLIKTQKMNRSAMYAVEICMDEMTAFVENVRRCVMEK